jgi:signal transduction histidine kinase
MARTDVTNQSPEPDLPVADAERGVGFELPTALPESEPKEIAPAPVSTDVATAGLTLPLKIKLLFIFGGIVILFLAIVGVTGWTFWRLTDQSNRVTTDVTRLEQLQQLRMSWLGEQMAVSRGLAPDASGATFDFERSYYRITFDNSLFLLNKQPDYLRLFLQDIETRHLLLVSDFYVIAQSINEGNPSRALVLWKDAQPRITDLTARITDLAEVQTRRVEAAKIELDVLQGQVWWIFGIMAGGGSIILILLIWLANRTVIIPMGRLNVKLGQLLYGQTARITDRLNELEYDAATQIQKVATARHDMKLPLSNIRNAAEITLICHPELPPDANENLHEIIETTDASAESLNKLLARPDSRLRLAHIELLPVLEYIVELVDLREYKLHLRVELERATADPDLLEHALLNLLSNARKFSGGGIGIGTRLHEKRDGSEAEIWVWNDGPIIAATERDLIFRAGGQTDTGKSAGGHGLGLWIVKNIVERHGGRIVVESHEKVGTTFRVFLPYGG